MILFEVYSIFHILFCLSFSILCVYALALGCKIRIEVRHAIFVFTKCCPKVFCLCNPVAHEAGKNHLVLFNVVLKLLQRNLIVFVCIRRRKKFVSLLFHLSNGWRWLAFHAFQRRHNICHQDGQLIFTNLLAAIEVVKIENQLSFLIKACMR